MKPPMGRGGACVSGDEGGTGVVKILRSLALPLNDRKRLALPLNDRINNAPSE